MEKLTSTKNPVVRSLRDLKDKRVREETGRILVEGEVMIREALSKDEEEADCELCCKKMLPLAIATSIDALAVGVTFAFLQVNILWAVCFIGVITFLLSCLGVKIGNIFGLRYKAKAELCGGVILLLMGLKILLEHLGILA